MEFSSGPRTRPAGEHPGRKVPPRRIWGGCGCAEGSGARSSVPLSCAVCFALDPRWLLGKEKTRWELSRLGFLTATGAWQLCLHVFQVRLISSGWEGGCGQQEARPPGSGHRRPQRPAGRLAVIFLSARDPIRRRAAKSRDQRFSSSRGMNCHKLGFNHERLFIMKMDGETRRTRLRSQSPALTSEVQSVDREPPQC